jgi:hypothetical protein
MEENRCKILQVFGVAARRLSTQPRTVSTASIMGKDAGRVLEQ